MEIPASAPTADHARSGPARTLPPLGATASSLLRRRSLPRSGAPLHHKNREVDQETGSCAAASSKTQQLLLPPRACLLVTVFGMSVSVQVHVRRGTVSSGSHEMCCSYGISSPDASKISNTSWSGLITVAGEGFCRRIAV